MASQFALEIVTPEKVFYNDEVEMVIMRTTNGDRAILKDHIPFVAGLVEGQLRVKKDGKFKVTGQMLHAKTLGFNHPITGKYVEFESNLPNEFLNIIDKLEKKENASQ